MRLIDADHLIQRATNPFGDCWSSTGESTADFVDYINEEPTVEVKTIVYGEWVSAKEKLPKDGVDVLAYLKSGEYVIRHIVEVFGYKEWSGGQIGERTHNVIAWQPLPAPYKESEEE